MAAVQSLRSLLLNCHYLVVMDSLECDLPALFLPLVILEELVKVFILIKTAFYAVFVGPIYILVEIIFVYGENVSV